MSQIGDLEFVALGSGEAYFNSKAIQSLGMRSWAFAKQVILDMQEMKRILQRQPAASRLLPIQQGCRTVRRVLDVPGSEIAVDPKGGQRIRIAQFCEGCRYGCEIASRSS